MRELGYDPKMLGHHRTKNLIRLIRVEAESREGLHNGYKKRTPKRMTPAEIEELGQNPESYARLKAEVIYLREEVEFLKKSRSRRSQESEANIRSCASHVFPCMNNMFYGCSSLSTVTIGSGFSFKGNGSEVLTTLPSEFL